MKLKRGQDLYMREFVTKNETLLFALIVFLVPFLVYFYTLAPTVSVLGDSGELIQAAYTTGVAHPPGYPLFILFLKLFFLLPFGELAWKANLGSAFLGAAGVLLLFLILKRFLKNELFAASGALTLSFSEIFWRNSVISEVYTMLAALTLLTIYAYIRWREGGGERWLYASVLFAGFGFFHHPMIIFVLMPLFVAFIFERRRKGLVFKNYALGALVFLLGSLPYLYYLVVPLGTSTVSWGFERNFTGLVSHFTRGEIDPLRFSNQLVEPVVFWGQVVSYSRVFADSLVWPGVILFVLGLLEAYRKNRGIFVMGLVIFLLSGIVFSFYAKLPFYHFWELSVGEIFLIYPLVISAVFVAFGLAGVERFIQSSWPGRKPVSLGLAAFVVGIVFISNFSEVNQRANYFGINLARDIFDEAPPNQVLVIRSDADVNAVFYAQNVLGERKDVPVVILGLLSRQWYREEIAREYPLLKFPDIALQPREDYLREIITLNKPREFFLRHEFFDTLLVRLNGLTWSFSDKTEEEEILVFEQGEEVITKKRNLTSGASYPSDWIEAAVLTEYAQPYAFLAEHYEFLDPEKSLENVNKILDIAPANYLYWGNAGDLLQDLGRREEAIEAYKKLIKGNPFAPNVPDVQETIRRLQRLPAN